MLSEVFVFFFVTSPYYYRNHFQILIRKIWNFFTQKQRRNSDRIPMECTCKKFKLNYSGCRQNHRWKRSRNSALIPIPSKLLLKFELNSDKSEIPNIDITMEFSLEHLVQSVQDFYLVIFFTKTRFY